MAADAMEKARGLLAERKRELEAELRQIEQGIKSLGGNGRGPGRPRGSGSKRSGPTGKRRRRSGGGQRANQAIKIIGENPGITVSELAKKMKLKAPNYLYRVLPGLVEEGKIKKDGKGYKAAS